MWKRGEEKGVQGEKYSIVCNKLQLQMEMNRKLLDMYENVLDPPPPV